MKEKRDILTLLVTTHPEAMNVIRADAVRKKKEERKAREIKEAAERREKERIEALLWRSQKTDAPGWNVG